MDQAGRPAAPVWSGRPVLAAQPFSGAPRRELLRLECRLVFTKASAPIPGHMDVLQANRDSGRAFPRHLPTSLHFSGKLVSRLLVQVNWG